MGGGFDGQLISAKVSWKSKQPTSASLLDSLRLVPLRAFPNSLQMHSNDGHTGMQESRWLDVAGCQKEHSWICVNFSY